MERIKTLYHFTDNRNIASIRQRGGLYSLAQLQILQVETVWFASNKESRNMDKERGIDNYVHLCFHRDHEMQKVAQHYAERIEDTKWLEVSPHVLKFDKVMFCSDIANKRGAKIVLLSEAEIDYEVICEETDWGDNDIKRRLKQARRCEVLIPQHIPLKYYESVISYLLTKTNPLTPALTLCLSAVSRRVNVIE